MKRSIFARVELAVEGYDVVVGVAERPGYLCLERPTTGTLLPWLKAAVYRLLADDLAPGHYILAREVEARVEKEWPGREYFVEVGEQGMSLSTQIYARPDKSVERTGIGAVPRETSSVG